MLTKEEDTQLNMLTRNVEKKKRLELTHIHHYTDGDDIGFPCDHSLSKPACR